MPKKPTQKEATPPPEQSIPHETLKETATINPEAEDEIVMPDSYAINIQIGAQQDRELIWEPVRVQVKLDKMAELEWRQKTSQAFPAMLVAKPFKWSAEGVIQIDITIDGHKAKAIYDPGCLGVAISQAWASKRVLELPTHFPITIASAEGVLTIQRTVFTGLKINWKGS